jgi:hypothetical protein
LRNLWKINNKPTKQWDYKALHPRLLYNYYLKQALDFDPYMPTGFSIEYRPILKCLMLIAINAEDKKSACRAAWRLFSKRKINTKSLLQRRNIKETEHLPTMPYLLGKLIEHNKSISNYICSGEGVRLQRLDSKLCYNITKVFTKSLCPIIPIHDGFIVAEEDASLLRDTMVREYYNLIGFYPEVD